MVSASRAGRSLFLIKVLSHRQLPPSSPGDVDVLQDRAWRVAWACAAVEEDMNMLVRGPGRIDLIDFTRLRSLFRSVVVGAVIDLISRKLLAIRVAATEPDAGFAVRLLREAIKADGRPRWIVTDQGTQFRSRRFTGYLRRRIRRRFGAGDRISSQPSNGSGGR